MASYVYSMKYITSYVCSIEHDIHVCSMEHGILCMQYEACCGIGELEGGLGPEWYKQQFRSLKETYISLFVALLTD